MPDIVKNKRSKSKLEVADMAEDIRIRLEQEMLISFGYSQKIVERRVQKWLQQYKPEEREKAEDRIRKMIEEHAKWFIDHQRTEVEKLCCDLEEHIDAANTIWPNFAFEYKDRRDEWNQALKACNRLEKRLQHIGKTLPADKNRYMRITKDLSSLFNKIKKTRQSDNRFIPHLVDPEDLGSQYKR